VKVCFPITNDNGIDSTLYGHFASTPLFLVFDTVTHQSSIVPNHDEKNPFAGCNPFSALKGRQLDGIVVGGIGDEALRAMNLCGFRVFEAQSESISENIPLFEKNELFESIIQDSHLEGRCSDNGVPHKCNHTHDHEPCC